MQTLQSSPQASIASLVETRTRGEGTTIVIGATTQIAGCSTLNIPGRLYETAAYLKAEYPRYKRLVSVDRDIKLAVEVAYKTASGLYCSKNGKLADNVCSIPRSAVALMVLKQEKSEAAFDAAAFELAKESYSQVSVISASEKLSAASGKESSECSLVISQKTERVAAWLEKYSDKYTHPHVIKDAPMVYLQHSVTKVRYGFRAMLKLPTGFGKTSKLLNPAIQSYLDAGKKVLVISHRRSIIKNIAMPGLVDYEDVRIGQMTNARGLKIVINSLISARFDDFLQGVDLVVLDEAAQVIDHALQGSVRDRDEVWSALQRVVWNAKSVIFADADCNDECLALIKKQDEPVSIFELDQAHANINCKIGSIDQVRSLAITTALAGENTLIAIDIARDAEALGKVLEKSGIEPLVITSKTAGWPAQSAFISNPNTNAHQVVIYSPAITSALSIISGHFRSHFGLFEGSVTPRGAIQMMRRDRTARTFTIGLRNPQNKREEIAYVEFDASAKSEFDTARKIHMKRTGWLRDNIQLTLPYELKRQGFQLEVIPNDDSVGVEGFKANSTGRHAAKKDNAFSLLNAKPATEIEAKRVQKFGSNSESEHFAALRYNALQGLKRKELSFADCQFWGEGVGQVKIDNYHKLHADSVTTFQALVQELYKGLLSGNWTPAQSVELYDQMNEVRHEAILSGFKMPKYTGSLSDRSKQGALSKIMSLHGLKTKRKDGGKSGYYYIICPMSLQRMREYTGS